MEQSQESSPSHPKLQSPQLEPQPLPTPESPASQKPESAQLQETLQQKEAPEPVVEKVSRVVATNNLRRRSSGVVSIETFMEKCEREAKEELEKDHMRPTPKKLKERSTKVAKSPAKSPATSPEKSPAMSPTNLYPKSPNSSEIEVGSTVMVKFRLGSKDYDKGVVVKVEPSGKFTVNVNGVIREGVKRDYISLAMGEEEEGEEATVDAGVLRKVKNKIRAAAMGRDLERLFKSANKSKTGSLSREEFRVFCRRVLKLTKNDVTDEAMEDLFAYLDKDGKGAVDWEALTNFMKDTSTGEPVIAFGQAANITAKLMGMKKRAHDRLNKSKSPRSSSKSPTRSTRMASSPSPVKFENNKAASPPPLPPSPVESLLQRKTLKMIQVRLHRFQDDRGATREGYQCFASS